MRITIIYSCIFTLLISHLSFSQWSFSEKNDPFDGNIKTVLGIGNGGNFPYKNPVLVFRIKNNKREIYLTDAGSTVCDKPYLNISFGDPNSVLNFELSESVDSRAGFINMDESKKIYELVKNLMKKNTAYFKFGTNCSANKFQVSLKGSSKSLSKIFSDIDFSVFDSNISFGSFYSAPDSNKMAKSKLYLENFFLANDIELSKYDLDIVINEIKKGISIRKLELNEIIIEKHKTRTNTFKLKLGFEGLHYRDTEFVFNKKN